MQLHPHVPPIDLPQSFHILMEKIQVGQMVVNQSQNKKIIAVMGNVGSGKSTLINDLCGCDIHSTDPKKLGIRSLQRRITVVKAPAEGGSKEELIAIQHINKKDSFLPALATDAADNIYCEFSGFLGDSSFEINIARAIILPAVLNNVSQLKIVLLISYSSLQDKKMNRLSGIIHTCSQLFGSREIFQKHLSSVLLGVTQVPSLSHEDEGKRKSIRQLKEYIASLAEGSEEEEIFSQLAEKLFIYAPIQADSLCYENASQREDIFSLITNLTTMDRPLSFQAVITAEDLNHLDKICRAIGQQIGSITEKKELADSDFQQLAAMKQLLNPVALLRHQPHIALCLERIQTILTDRFKMLAAKFNHLCEQEDPASFKTAQTLLQDIERGLKYFDPATRQFLLKLFQEPLGQNETGPTQLIGAALIQNALHNQRLQDLTLAAKGEAERLGDRLQSVVREFDIQTSKMSQSLHALAKRLENECSAGDLSAASLSKAHALLSFTQFTKETIHTTSQQCIDLEKKGAHGVFSNFQQTLEVALYARKLEIDFMGQQLDLIQRQMDHEQMIFFKIHTIKLKEEMVLFDQLLQIQEQEQMAIHRDLYRESASIEQRLRELRLTTEISQQEQRVYNDHRRRMTCLKIKGLRETHRLDVEARCHLAKLLVEAQNSRE